jgi:hypothetical protein
MDLDTSHAARLADYAAVSTSLALRGDRELRELIDAAAPLGSGIGGPTALMEVEGRPVFVKRVPLSDLELAPENVRSTANFFDLPTFCHYGVSGLGGFGAWRELAAQTMTTNWVLARDFEGFPLMYHWRVLPHPGQVLPEELADVEGVIASWGGGAGVRRRLEGLRDATASIALFLEYFPHNLHDWLDVQVKAEDEVAERTCAMVERELAAGTSFMNARGLLHFDAHFQNLLTDGERLFFADYGLAISSRFDLAAPEAAFFAEHQDYDARYSFTHLAIWLVTALYGYRREERRAFLHACAQGERPTGIPPRIADIISRHAPTAEVMTGFYRDLLETSRQTPYPVARIQRACA